MDSKKRNIGRPPVMPDEKRRVLILEAAEAVFLKNGYGQSSMEDIAKECGFSKKTLYRFFDSKAELLSHLIQTVGSDGFVTGQPGTDVPTPREKTHRIFCDLARFVFSARQLELLRLVISEAKSNPQAARQFFRDNMLHSQKIIAGELPHLVGESISPDKRDLLADILIGAVIGPIQIRSLLWEEDLDTILVEIEQRLDLIFHLFNPPH